MKYVDEDIISQEQMDEIVKTTIKPAKGKMLILSSVKQETKMSEWDETKPIDVEVLKQMVTDMRMARDIYEDAKELSGEAHAKFKEKEAMLLLALEQSGLKNFSIPGLGTASVRRTFKVTTPKDLESKRELFNYVSKKYGEDFLDAFRGINSQSLNKFYNEEMSAAEETGIELKVPGLADPVEHTTINFRKETK